MPTQITIRSVTQLAARHLAFARSPAGLIVILAASLFVAEVIAMLLLAELPTMPPLLTNVLDATILVGWPFQRYSRSRFGRCSDNSRRGKQPKSNSKKRTGRWSSARTSCRRPTKACARKSPSASG